MTKAEILKRVRAKCLDCCCGSSNEVKRCHIESCPLHPIRFGVNPDKRELPEEKKMVLRERMKKALQAKAKKSILTKNSKENTRDSQKNCFDEG